MRTLPNGKPISPLGFGCSSVWSKPSFPLETATAVFEAALAKGINHFDTGPSYAEGELRLGRLLQGRNAANLVLSTKVGTEVDHNRSFDPDRMAASFAGSLARLAIPQVDILYLHGPAISDLTPATFDFFDRLKREGQIVYSGVNSFDPAVVEACIDSPIDAVMLQYSVADRRFDGLIENLAAADKIVIAGTILAQGIFDLKTFVPRDRKQLWYLLRALKADPLFMLKGRALARRMARLALPPHEAAVRFAVANAAVTSSLFGTSNPAHVIANAAASGHALSSEQVALVKGAEK